MAKVARIDGNTVTDITATYKSFENYDEATQVVPYVGGYFEFDGVGYWIASGVKQQYVNNIAELQILISTLGSTIQSLELRSGSGRLAKDSN